MHARWYPAALSMSVLACGASVDDGKPSATGGFPQYFYGPSTISGGATGIDSGQPLATGGQRPMVEYGPAFPNTGGTGATGPSSGAGGSTSTEPKATGGGTTIDSGIPSTGGFYPIPMYMANLRLPPKDCTEESKKYYARAFEPRIPAQDRSPIGNRGPTGTT